MMSYKNKYLFIPLVAICFMFFTSCGDRAKQFQDIPEEQSLQQTENDIERGKYLVEIMGCNDCHSPKRIGNNGPELIPELLLSGYPSDRPIIDFASPLIQQGFSVFYPDLTAAIGPWGISFAANLTPHPTGLGNWTAEQFKIALTQGKSKGLENARMLLPPMPWVNYSSMKEEDVLAIFSYLRSITPVENVVPAPVAPEAL